MPKRSKERLTNRYLHLYRDLERIEFEIWSLQLDCENKTSCFLHYAPWAADYVTGLPHKGSVKILDNGKRECVGGFEEWQMVLGDFYAEQTTKLLRERENILREMWRLASKIYKSAGRPRYGLSYTHPHERKPWFNGMKP